LLALFGIGVLLIYASTLADRQSGHGRSALRTLGVDIILLSVSAAVLGAVLQRHLSADE
jgi:hypothetical protein